MRRRRGGLGSTCTIRRCHTSSGRPRSPRRRRRSRARNAGPVSWPRGRTVCNPCRRRGTPRSRRPHILQRVCASACTWERILLMMSASGSARSHQSSRPRRLRPVINAIASRCRTILAAARLKSPACNAWARINCGRPRLRPGCSGSKGFALKIGNGEIAMVSGFSRRGWDQVVQSSQHAPEPRIASR